MSIYRLPISHSIHLSTYLPKGLSTCLSSVYLSVSLPVCLHPCILTAYRIFIIRLEHNSTQLKIFHTFGETLVAELKLPSTLCGRSLNGMVARWINKNVGRCIDGCLLLQLSKHLQFNFGASFGQTLCINYFRSRTESLKDLILPGIIQPFKTNSPHQNRRLFMNGS